MPSEQICDDWIKLCEAPAHKELFFVGAGENRITFYSQQVRAMHLVHALHRKGRLQPNDRVAVVGAGAAGVAAAIALACVGARVELFEGRPHVLGLQRGSPRLLHPNIYDWPMPGALLQSASLPFLDWSRDTAANVQNLLARQLHLAEVAAAGKLAVRLSISVTGLRAENEQWIATWKKQGETATNEDAFEKVFLAAGFGNEQTIGQAPPVDYWIRPTIALSSAENAKYFLSGTGDGGLVDLAGIMIDGFDHLQFTEEFLQLFRGSELAEAVKQAEVDVQPYKGDLGPAFQQRVLPVLQRRGAIEYVRQRLAPNRFLVLNRQIPILAKGAAARLNQVMSFALLEAAERQGGGILRFSQGDVGDVVLSNGNRYVVVGPHIDGASIGDEFNSVILHHGPNRIERYLPFANYHQAYRIHRDAVVEGSPELGEPPRLHPGTFDFFYEKFSPLCVIYPDAARVDARATHHQTIDIALDVASGELVQRGLSSLEVLLEKIEALTSHYVIRLAVHPDQLKGAAKALPWMVKASNGRIRLTAVAAVRNEWLKIYPAVELGSAIDLPHQPSKLTSEKGISDALDAALLRLIAAKLSEVFVANHCSIGPIHSSIVEEIKATWADWHHLLNDDPMLRREFLRLLSRAEQDGKEPWDGDHGAISRLASGLVLTLATRIGQPLQPGLCSPGNLALQSGGVALGSGCATIKGVAIENYEDPDAWSVDALVLSEARATMFEGLSELITAAGGEASTFAQDKKVRPAVIQSSRFWRQRLQGDVANWRQAVEAEFENLRDRQDKQFPR